MCICNNNKCVLVIVIIGIISFISIPRNNNKKHTLYLEKEKLVTAIKYTQHLSMQYNSFNPRDKDWYKKSFCIEIEQNKISIDKNGTYAKNPLDKKDYIIKFENSINSEIDRICFDNIGRPYKNNIDYSSNVLHKNIDINISNLQLILWRETGYLQENL